MPHTIPRPPDQRIPRYTSYPTAPHFHAGVTAADYGAWLRAIPDAKPISLYLHIPYCHEMCWYCGCHTKVTRRYAPVRDYLATLREEIAHVAAATPTIVTPDDFAAVMHHLRDNFAVADTAEVAVEIDPRTLSPEMVDAMAAAGVTRASLGVQDVNAHVQHAINRVQPFDRVADTVTALRGAGIAAINFDLMYGLPHQTVADVERTVDQGLTLEPDRVAAFGYAHVPWMKPHQKLIDETALPDAEARVRQADAIATRLAAGGYRPIGLDHFARPDDPLAVALAEGTLRRNFQGYTTDSAATVLGFGASAISTLRGGYTQNHPDLRAYARAVETDGLATTRGVAVTDDDRRRRAIIERLMCALTVDLADFAPPDLAPTGFATELDTLRHRFTANLVAIDGTRVTVTSRAGRGCASSAPSSTATLLPAPRAIPGRSKSPA